MTTMPIPSSAACWRRCLFPPPLKDPPRGVALLRPLAGLLAPLPSLRLRYRGLFCSSPPPSSSSSSSSFEEISGRSSPALHPWLRMEHLWAGGSTDKNKGLVEQLKRYGIIKSNKIAEVMQTIDRAIFVPEDTPAYVDSPMPIGFNATISAPHMHATCLELLKDHLQPGMHALDVGSGTGYLTACFALMIGLEGRAVGVEHIPELVASSVESIKRSAASSLFKDGHLSVHVAGVFS